MRSPARELTVRRPLALAALLVLFAPACAFAGTSPPGLNLRWDRCFGDGGVQYKTFACNTNTGFEQLVGSFELASDVPNVSGVEFYVSIGGASAALPAWWQFFNAGTCHQGGLSAQLVPPAGSNQCADWANTLGSGGIAAYQSFTGGGRTFRLVIGAGAVSSADVQSLLAGQEYFSFDLRVSHTKTVGTGSCAGCLDPVCLFYSGAKIVQPTSPASILLTRGANYSGSQWVSWQQGYPLNAQLGCLATGGGLFCLDPVAYFDVVPYSTTPPRTSTWGAVKSLYR